MKIHADPITVNCKKVLAGLQLMGADYDLVHVDYFQGAHKAKPFIDLNPNASVPALVDGDFVLWESNAILQYAADKIGNDRVYPKDLKTRSDLNRWLLWEAAHWFPSCYVYLVENCVKPLLGGAPDPTILEAQDAQFHKLADILDKRLEGRRWVMGDQPTLADIALAAPMHLHGWQKLPLAPHPNVVCWMKDVEQLPCWQSTMVYEGFTLQKQEVAA